MNINIYMYIVYFYKRNLIINDLTDFDLNYNKYITTMGDFYIEKKMRESIL